MYESGAIGVVLGGRLVRTGFVDWGRQVARSREEARKPVEANLRARDEASGPIRRFVDSLVGARKNVLELQGTVDKSMVGVGRSITEASVKADRGFVAMGDGAKRVSEQVLGVGGSFKTMASEIDSASTRADTGMARMADKSKVQKDTIVRNNEEIIASQREVAKNYANPLGAGGRGGGGGVTAVGAAGETPGEQQAKKTTRAWKDGFNTMSTIGKWATVSMLGIGAVSVKWAADFQRNMTLLETQAGYTDKQVQRLRKSVLDLAPAVGVGPNELAKGLYYIASNGIPASKAMDVLKTAAEGAKIGMAGMEETTSALVSVMRAAPKDIHSSKEAMGVMIDIVGQGKMRMDDLNKALSSGVLATMKGAGLGLRDLGAALDIMTQQGVPAEQAATRLRTTLSLIESPTGKASKALGELGITQDQLANTMRNRGLAPALGELKAALDRTFPPGRKLTVEQERTALEKYGKILQDQGVTGKAAEKQMILFKESMDKTGSSATAQSGLILQAFGGSRMGTTMQTLMQHFDDLNKHVNKLQTDNVAGQFNKAWDKTKTDFSVQLSQMWAGIQELGIRLGDWLIPKVKAVINAFIDFGKYLQHHEALAKTLAFLFGTLLVAAIGAFFGKLGAGMYNGLRNIGAFSKAIVGLPKTLATATEKMLKSLLRVKEAQDEVTTSAEDMGAAQAGAEAEAGAGGVAGEAGAAEHEAGVLGMGSGAIEGMITGAKGSIMAPGSEANPIAVVMLAGERYGLGGQSAAGAAKTEASVASEARQVEQQSAPIIGAPARAASNAEATLMAETAPAEIGGEAAMMGGAAGGLRGRIAGIGGKVMGGLGMAGMGVLGAQVAGGVIGGSTGSAVSTIGSTAAIGAGLGSMAGPMGTAIGGALGVAAGIAIKIFGGSGKSYGQEIADHMTKGFGGSAADSLKKQLASALDDARKLEKRGGGAANMLNLPTPRLTLEQQAQMAKDYHTAGRLVAQQLEAGWNQYKFASEPIMFKEFRAETAKLPVAARDAAAESALNFAKKLESEGRLPKGAAQKMLQQIKSVYPEFAHYVGLQGTATWKNFMKAEDAKHTNDRIKGNLNTIANEFMDVRDKVGSYGDDLQKTWGATWDILLHHVHDKSKKSRDTALSGIQQMVKDAQGELPNLPQIMKTMSGRERDELVNNLGQSIEGVRVLMRRGIIHTADGMKQINALIAGEMKALDISIADKVVTAASKFNPINLFKGTSLQQEQPVMPGFGRATGGMLPGSEYGNGDVMTLVDPRGVPRAKMAGDEAVFNRHQMPFVDMGLQAIGFEGGATELWHKVNTPHGVGFATGGQLKKFATGGYVFPYNPKMSAGRTDMGFDASGSGPIGAIGNAVVTRADPQGSHTGWPGAAGAGTGAMIVYRLTNGIDAGKYVYLAENVDPTVRVGQQLRAGQVIANARGFYPFTEMGWAADASGRTLASATTGYTEGEQTVAGKDFTKFIEGLAHGKLFGGGAGAIWQDIKAPSAKMGGQVGRIVQAALNKMTKAANQRGQKDASQITAPGGAVPSAPVGNIMALAQAAAKWAGVPWDANIVRELLSKESSGGQNLPPHSYGGILDPAGPFQVISSTFASNAAPGHGDRMNPYDNALAAFHYIKGRYGTLANLASRTGLFSGSYVGYAKGGYLHHHATGRNPWAPLPSVTGLLPGFRPIRTRRGAGGLHTVGGANTPGSRRGSTTKGTSTASSGAKQTARKKQPISQNTAAVLTALGLGSFASNQNKLGQLDTQYSMQENLFTLYDGSSGNGLPQADLNVLMGIREAQWDILYNEWQALPHAISVLQSTVKTTEGTAGHAGHKAYVTHTVDKAGHKKTVHHPAVRAAGPSGVAGTQKQITDTQNEIGSLHAEVTRATRQQATIRHNISARAMSTADQFAQAEAQYLENQTVLTDAHIALVKERAALRARRKSVTSGGSTAIPTNAELVGQVMAGQGFPIQSSSASSHTQTQNIDRQLADLSKQDAAITGSRSQLSKQYREIRLSRSRALAALRHEGADQAWAIQLKKWKVEDRIVTLKDKLANLKKLLSTEQAQLSSEKDALTQVQGWQSGGLEGSESILQSLGDTGMNILGLYQQGASLPAPPPPGRKSPTLQLIESILSGKPPKGLGLTLPPGLTQATQSASQALAEFQAFQQSRSDLFSQFGSNFVQAGANPFAGTAGLGAGVQYYGAAAGSAGGPGAPGGFARGGYLPAGTPQKGGDTNVNVTNHFAAGPPDPHSWSAGVGYELRATV